MIQVKWLTKFNWLEHDVDEGKSTRFELSFVTPPPFQQKKNGKKQISEVNFIFFNFPCNK